MTRLGDDAEKDESPGTSSSAADAAAASKHGKSGGSPSRLSSDSAASSGVRTSSVDSDPLEPLELALTPDQSTPADREAAAARARSRSRSRGALSVASSRQRSVVGGASAAGGGAGAGGNGLPLAATSTRASSTYSAGQGPVEFEVTFGGPEDQLNPRNWSLAYRGWTVFNVSFSTWVVVLYSTSYTAAIPGMIKEFDVASEPVVTLGVTTYLLGLAVGSLVVAPMSELYGRKPVYLICLALFSVMIVPCAVAKSLTEIIVFRFLGAVFGSAMVSNSPGSVVDISDEEYRALTMSLWSIAPLNGPVTGPLIGGFVYEYLGWRWDNWIVLIISGVATLLMTTVRETYAPAILQRRAAQLRKETGDERWWCRYEQQISTWNLLKINLSRPFILSFTEPILWFFNIWISIIYGILYLCFVSYPIVYSQIRGWSPGTSGLAFVGMGVGTMIAILSEPLLRRIINSHPKDPATGRVPPEASASVMLIGAVLTPIGQLVFAWTCVPPTHWAVGIAFGIPFGAGNTLSFIYGSNYLAGAYGIYAASALAGNAVMRSFFGGTLPLAGPSMYAAMTPQWAGTFLGLLQVILIGVPLIFYRYGERIRAKSKVIQQMREDAARNEGRRERRERKLKRIIERRAAAAAEESRADEDGGEIQVVRSRKGRLGRNEKDLEKGSVRGVAVFESDKVWKEKDDTAP